MQKLSPAFALGLAAHLGCYDPQLARSGDCAAAPRYDALVNEVGFYAQAEDGSVALVLSTELDVEDPTNLLELTVSETDGTLVVPASFYIEGKETGFETCHVCVTIYGDLDPVTDHERQLYHAQSGRVTIDSAEGTLSGSLQGVVLQELDRSTDLPAPGGCETRIDVAFSAPLDG